MEQAQRRGVEDPAVARTDPANGRGGGGTSAARAFSIGAYLSRQRTLRGISLDELAQLTRIPLRSLARLEAGAFDRDPDGFARGFVRTVAGALGLPPDETVARMLPEVDASAARAGSALVAARWLAVAAVLALLVGLATWVLASDPKLPIGWTRGRDAVVYRHDAVRALAVERGLWSPGRSTTAASGSGDAAPEGPAGSDPGRQRSSAAAPKR
jgi:transcriptional regulator with XRE-family HTH domain